MIIMIMLSYILGAAMLSEDSVAKKFKTIFIAGDHAGLEMKRHLIGRFPFLPWKDLGPFSTESVDYPDFAEKLGLEMRSHLEDSRGVLVCGSGQGIAIRANRFPGRPCAGAKRWQSSPASTMTPMCCACRDV